MIYFFVIIGLLILIYFYDYKEARRNRFLWFMVALFVLIIIAGFRYRLGTDSVRYERYFTNVVPTLSKLHTYNFADSRFSPLYIILNSAIRTVTDQFIVFQIVHAIIVNSIIFYFIYRNTRKIFFGVLFYFIFQYFGLNMEVLREALAVCVFLLAWPFFRDGKWIMWFLMSFIAFMCHTSGVFMFILPIIVLPGIRSLFVFGKRTIIICCCLYVVLLFIRVRFFEYVQALAVLDSVGERAKTYAEDDLASSSLSIVGLFILSIKSFFFPLCAIYLLRKENNANFEDGSRFLSMSLMSVYIGICAILIPIFYRFNNYFVFFILIAYADVVFSNIFLNKSRIRLPYYAWILIFVPLFFIQSRSTFLGNVNKSGTLKGYMNYYPYSSRLDMEKDPNREKVFKYNHSY